eukprot:TRINITY_DN8812_c0_g1_i2.p1 TRINITY_DN8812_c0_g1~~TRINITY_DN8812_c0_g1_i2.p1  ORF type:complete len:734 (+),score=136.75 TRINITY_DN8812_c0_g1_i2:245-2203(+)
MAPPRRLSRALSAVGWTPRYVGSMLNLGSSKSSLARTPRFADQPQPSGDTPRPSAVKNFWSLTKPMLLGSQSKSRWLIRLLGILLVLLLVGESGVLIWFSYANRKFTTALALYDEAGFHAGIWNIVGVIAVAMPLVALIEVVKGGLVVEWRRQLSKSIIKSYLVSTDAYYVFKQCRDGVDNPDQRIGQDIGDFCYWVTETASAIVHASFTLVTASGVLISLSPELFGVLVAYAVVGTLIMLRVFGLPLMRIQRHMLGLEASFRFDLVRIRENAEAIAFHQGNDFEATKLYGVVDNIISNLYRKIRIFVGCNSFKRGYSWITLVIPAIVIGPKYLRREIDLGALTQVGVLFGSLLEAMLILVNRLDSIAGLSAQAVRICELMRAIDRIAERKVSKDSSCNIVLEEIPAEHMDDNTSSDEGMLRLGVENVTLKIPCMQEGQEVLTLCSGVSFKLDQGQSLLISGMSGVGKSSFLRAIGGLWRNGSGRMQRPSRQKCFFLPQSPYMCQGSLREQILYPGGIEVSDEELEIALREVNLEYLVQRYGLDASVDFASMLSLGEQQRLAFARLLVHKDIALALIDEGTSALDESNEARLYEMLQRRIGCFVSVCHRPQMYRFHSHKLHLKHLPGGGCTGAMCKIQSAPVDESSATVYQL